MMFRHMLLNSNLKTHLTLVKKTTFKTDCANEVTF